MLGCGSHNSRAVVASAGAVTPCSDGQLGFGQHGNTRTAVSFQICDTVESSDGEENWL
jgi:hypothetical protein